jgi:hypothetical protein
MSYKDVLELPPPRSQPQDKAPPYKRIKSITNLGPDLTVSSLKAKSLTTTSGLRTRDLNKILFYKRLQARLEDVFISAKAAAGGFTELKPGGFSKLDTWLDTTCDFIALTPLFGPLISRVIRLGIDGALKCMDQGRQEQRVAYLSSSISLAEISNLAQAIAKQLTHYYAPQLVLLPPLTSNTLQINLIKCPTRPGHGPAQTLADIVVLWIVEALENQVVTIGPTLGCQLLEVITVTKPNDWHYRTALLPYRLIKRLYPTRKEALAFLGSLTVKPSYQIPLYLPYLLLKTGIQTEAGDYYVGPYTEPERYGYSNGTKKIAQARHLTRIKTRSKKAFTQRTRP